MSPPVRPALSPEEVSQVPAVLVELFREVPQLPSGALVGAVASDRELFLALRRLVRWARNRRTVIEVSPDE